MRAGRACALACDVRDRAALEGVVARIATTLGGLDALVCAAGQLRGIGPMAMREPDAWWEDVEIARPRRPACRSGLACRWLRESDRASISVLVGPGHEGPLPFATGYGCAQAALVRLVESLGQELRPEKVPVYAVNPGLVPTGRRPRPDRHARRPPLAPAIQRGVRRGQGGGRLGRRRDGRLVDRRAGRPS